MLTIIAYTDIAPPEQMLFKIMYCGVEKQPVLTNKTVLL